MADIQEQFQRLTRHAEHVIPADELKAKLERGKPLRVKLGVDPTAKDITLGWAVPLRKLRQFQDEGHTAVLIMGDFTARIGDPSGKSQTRPQLSKDQVMANAEACVAQLLDILSEQNLEIRYNSEWLEPMDLPDLLKLTSMYTVAQMLERDDFSKRYADQQPISIVEFMYPLMQAYDSVAIKADVELGGTDQLFNLMVGRDLQRGFDQEPQVALTMPLLVGTDGVQKMSQSLSNYIAIREQPGQMFGKIMSIPDKLVGQYARLGTDFDDDQINDLEKAAVVGGPGAGGAKRAIARGVVSLYHGDEAAADAEAQFDRQFKEQAHPEQIPTAAIPHNAIDGLSVYLPRVMVELGLAKSGSDARRLIAQKGVKVNSETVTNEQMELSDLQDAVLQVGKRQFVRLAD